MSEQPDHAAVLRELVECWGEMATPTGNRYQRRACRAGAEALEREKELTNIIREAYPIDYATDGTARHELHVIIRDKGMAEQECDELRAECERLRKWLKTISELCQRL